MVRKGLLNRVLPAVLSAAMIFTSVPVNTLAAEATPAIEAEAEEAADLMEEAPAEEPAPEQPAEAAVGEESEDVNELPAVPQPVMSIDFATVKNRISTSPGTAAGDSAKYLSYAENYTFVTDYEYAQEAGLKIWQAVGNNATYPVGALTITTEVGEHESVNTGGVTINSPSNDGMRTDVITLNGAGGSWADEAYYNAVWTKEDGTALAVGEQPNSVGTWHLKFALTENAVHKAAEDTSITLVVKKTPILIDGVVQNAAAGSKVGDLIDENKAKFVLETAKVNNKWSTDANLEAIIDTAKTSITVSYATVGASGEVTVLDPAALPADTLFLKNTNYAVTFSFTLLDGATPCYELPTTSYLITVGDMAPVAPEFVYTDALIPSRGINVPFNGSEYKKENVINFISSAKFITGEDDGTANHGVKEGTEVDLITDVKSKIADENTAAANNLSTYWAYDAEGKKKLRDDEQVLHAGTYFFIVEYNDPTATYRKGIEAIKVNIVPVDIIVQPILEPTTVAEGYTAGEILADVTYKVLNTQSNTVIFSNKKGDTNYDEEKVTYFWGVAHTEDEFQSTQSYEPTFKIQKIEKQGDVTLDPVDVKDYETLVSDPNVSYRIVFTGKKAVRNRQSNKVWNGNAGEEYDINSTEGDLHDYYVSVDDATVTGTANIIALTVTKAAETTIDTTAITAAIEAKNVSADKAKGDKFSTPFEADFTADATVTAETKGLPLYANKGEYKKAVVKTTETVAQDNDESLTYSWQKFNEEDKVAVHSVWGDDATPDPIFKSRLEALEDEDGVVFDAPDKAPEKPATDYSVDDPLWQAYDKNYPAWIVWNDEGTDYNSYDANEDLFSKDQYEGTGNNTIGRNATWLNMAARDSVYGINGAPGEQTLVNSQYSFWDAENAIAPSEPGIYRLVIEYNDRKEHKNAPATAYVYYVIHPRDAMVEIAGTPTAYADGVITLKGIHESLQSTDSSKTNTYVKITLYEATLAADGTLTKNDPIPVPEEVQARIDANPTEVLKRQRKETVVPDKVKWNEYDAVIQYIEPGNDLYRFEFDAKSNVLKYGDLDYLGKYYNFYGLRMGKHNQLLSTMPDYTVATVALTVKHSDAIPVYIDLDESALESYSKIYDGKPIDLSKVKATVKEVDTDKEVAGATVDITWDATVGYTDQYSYTDKKYTGMPLAEAVHVSKYTITYHFYANEKYRTTTQDLSVQYRILEKELKIVPEIKTPVFAGNQAYVWTDGNPANDAISNNVVASWKLDETGLDIEGSDAGVIATVASNIDDVKSFAEVFETALNKNPLANNFDTTPEGIGNEYLKSETDYFVYLHANQTTTSGDALEPEILYDWMPDGFGFIVDYDYDYKLADTATAFTPVRNHSKVTNSAGDTTDLLISTTPYAEGADYTTTVKSIQGIKADTTTHDHFLTLLITRPQEFDTRGFGFTNGHFAFEESIANAVRTYDGCLDKSNADYIEGVTGITANTITVRFNVDKMQASETAAGVVKFDIVWDENGKYVEHYVIDLSKAPLLADLSIASLPKKVKFNAVTKKMFIGDTQQLDVKITKNQQEDVIWLGYESSDETILAINDMMTEGFKTDGKDGVKYYKDHKDYEGAGFVTALKAGKATITVYACKQVYDPVEKKDRKVKISEKALASVTINVKPVTAPKALKATPKDTWAVLQYKVPNNGMRRELYVMEGKVDKNTFEDKIKEVVNGNYTKTYDNDKAPFVYVQFGVDEQVWNKEKAAYEKAEAGVLALYDLKNKDPEGGDLIHVQDLTPDTQYTVYVRNVSGLRGLDDDARVSLSTAGAVKTFKTIKSAVIKLKLGVKGDEPGEWNDKSFDETEWQVMFKNRTAQMETSGWFLERYIKDYSDDPDYVWRKLPLTDATEKKAYQKQKLIYLVYDYGSGIPSTTAPEKKNMKFYGKYTLNGLTYYYKKSVLATIDKKGKLSLKGEGVVTVMVIDTVSGKSAETKVFIDAQPDTVTPVKKLKIQSGEMVRLSDLLTYKEGGKTINAYQGYSDPETKAHKDMYADLAIAETSNTDFRIEKIQNDTQGYKATPYWDEIGQQIGTRETYDYLITSLKKDGDLTVEITDSEVAIYGGAEKKASLRLTSKALEAVKNLTVKCKDSSGTEIGGVRHDYACGSYTHSIQGVYMDKGTDADMLPTGDGMLRVRQNLYDGGGAAKGKLLRSVVKTVKPINYDFNKKVWVYQWSESKLTPMQNYVIGITVLNDLGEETEYSKEVTKKFKTTNIAASTSNIKKDSYGGAHFYVSETGEASGVHTGEATLDHDAESLLNLYPLLTSGNTYTISPVLEHDKNGLWVAGDIITASNNRKSDKLSWKLSDTKVAKLKVKAGSYSASLQAKRPGITELTVTSKITKKVIARWPIYIGAVSNAKSYFGTNEPYSGSATWDYSYITPAENMIERDIIEVTLDNTARKTLAIGEAQWFVFEAPAYGHYYIYRNGTLYVDEIFEKGQKSYIRITNQGTADLNFWIDVTGDMYDVVTDTANGVGLKNEHSFVFYAPEDNFYTFSYVGDDKEVHYMSTTGVDPKDNKIKTISNNTTVTEAAQLTCAPGAEEGISATKGQEIRVSLLDKQFAEDDSKEYKIIVGKRSFTAIDEKTSGSFTLKNDNKEHPEYLSEVWFKFEAPDDGLYTFARTDADGSETVDVYSYSDNVFNENIKDVGLKFANATPIKGRTFAMQKGDIRIFVVRSTAATETKPATGTVSVKAEVFTDITLDAATATAATIEKDQTRYFRVVAPETEGAITVKAEELGTTPPDNAIVTYFADMNKFDDGTYGLAGEQEFTIVSGDTDLPNNKLQTGAPLYLKVVLNGGAAVDKIETAKLSAATKKVTKIVPGTPSAAENIENGKKLYYTFSVPKNGISKLYKFTVKVPEKTYVKVDWPDGSSTTKTTDSTADIVNYEVEKEEFLNGGILTITGTNDQPGAVTVQVDALDFDDIAFTAASPTVATVTKTAVKAGTYYFRFAADENDVYTYDFESKDATAIAVNEIDKTGAATNYFDVDPNPGYDTAGRKVRMGYINRSQNWIFFRVTTSIDDKDLNVRITKRKATALTKVDGTPEEIEIPVNSDGWFSFAAKEDTKYAFKIETDAAAGISSVRYYAGPTLTSAFSTALVKGTHDEAPAHDGKVYILNEVENKNAGVCGTINTKLNQNRTVYFRLAAGDKTTATKVKVTVTKFEPTPITLAQVGEGAAKFTIKDDSAAKNNNKGTWYRFVAPEEGSYTFILKSGTQDGGNYKIVNYNVIGVDKDDNPFDITDSTEAKTGLVLDGSDNVDWITEELKAGSKVDIHVYTGVDDEISGTLEIKRAATTELALSTEGKPDTQFDLTYDGAAQTYYTYTAEADGWYQYNLTTDKKDTEEMGAYASIYKKAPTAAAPTYVDDDTFNSTPMEGYFYLKQCDVATFTFERRNVKYPENTKEPVNVNIVLKKVEPKALGLDTAETVELTKKQEKWYSYKVAESGLYKLSIEATAKTFQTFIRLNGNMAVVNNPRGMKDEKPIVNQEVVGKEKFEEGFLLSKGDTIYFTATEPNVNDNATGTIKISKVNVESSSLKANDAPSENVAISVSGETWFYFGAQAPDTTYTFTTYENHIKDTTTAVTVSMSVYSAEVLTDADTKKPDGRYSYATVGTNPKSVNWTAGNINEIPGKYKKECYVKISDADAADPTEAAPFLGKVLVTTDTKLTLGNNTAFTLNHVGDSPYNQQVFTYTVPEDEIATYTNEGFYTISFTNDPGNTNDYYTKSVTITAKGGAATPYALSNTLMGKTFLLNEGDTVAVTLTYANTGHPDDDTKGTVTISEGLPTTLKSLDVVGAADPGSSYTVGKDSEMWFVFTPTIQDDYEITITNDYNLTYEVYKDQTHEVTVSGNKMNYTDFDLQDSGTMTATGSTKTVTNGTTYYKQKTYVKVYNNDPANEVTGTIKITKP